MKQFLFKFGLFLAIQAGIFAAMFAAAKPDLRTIIGATLDKHARLAELERMTGPRVLIVGGSNAAFGFDSQAIQQSGLGEPINLGLALNFGVEYILGEAQLAARKGDLIILSLEYAHYYRWPIQAELWDLLLIRPASAEVIARGQPSKLLDGGFSFISHVTCLASKRVFTATPTKPKPPYSRDAFNAFGDIVAHGGMPRRIRLRRGIGTDHGIPQEIAGTVEKIRDFTRTCEARGARVVLFFPPIPQDVARDHIEQLRPIIDATRSELGPRVLSTDEDLSLPDTAFFDTAYHLTREAAVAQTRIRVARIQAYLAESSGFPRP